MLTITVQIRSVYGTMKIYPICERAKIFASLLQQTTLTHNDIAKIKALGFAIEQQSVAVVL